MLAPELVERLPAQSVTLVRKWSEQFSATCVIVPPRKVKLGCCSYDFTTKKIVIRINDFLGPFKTLIILVHELAHAKIHRELHARVEPHGSEWKKEVSEMMSAVIALNIFPTDLACELKRHFKNPKYTIHNLSSADSELLRLLHKYRPAPEIPPDNAHLYIRKAVVEPAKKREMEELKRKIKLRLNP